MCVGGGGTLLVSSSKRSNSACKVIILVCFETGIMITLDEKVREKFVFVEKEEGHGR